MRLNLKQQPMDYLLKYRFDVAKSCKNLRFLRTSRFVKKTQSLYVDMLLCANPKVLPGFGLNL